MDANAEFRLLTLVLAFKLLSPIAIECDKGFILDGISSLEFVAFLLLLYNGC